MVLRKFNENGICWNEGEEVTYSFDKGNKDDGTYHIYNDIFYAVYRKFEKVYLIVGDKYFDLKDPRFSLELEKKDNGIRVFFIKDDTSIIYTLRYLIAEQIILDPWCDEDDLDFFSWLTRVYKMNKLDLLFVE